jgi:PKD repeat protein
VVLNNPVSLNLPAEFIISKYKVSDSGSVTIDVKEYVADVETAPGNMLYTANMQYNTMEGLATIANTGTGVYTITAGANIISPITFTATVDDTDGSTATDSAKIKIIISFVPRPPVAKFTWSPASPVTKESVLFDASSSSDSDGTITSYAWDFGNGLTATGVTPSHVFAAKGSYNVKLTITDNDGLASSITKIITIAEKENPLFFDEMGCNPDVVQGHEEYCSVHVTNEQGDNVENVAVTFTYTDPSSVASVHFGFCTTDNKGYCHDDLIVNYSPGLYTVTATASKQDYLAPAPKSDTFKVWAERYAINDLKVFSDAAFKVEEDTFYRSEDMYVSFTIYDMFEQKNVCDDSVVREAFLRVNNADPLKLVEITQRTNVEALGNDLKNVIGGACEYKFVLSKIPLSDDYLGSGKVFAFSFNFEDNTAGQATKTVTVLNNPLSFGLPAEFIIAKYVATDKGSITIDLKQYVSDVETLAADMIFTLTTSESSITIEKSSNNNGIYIVSALEGKTGEFTVFASADDTDGSKVTGTTLVRITVDFTPQLPVAIAGPDKTTTVKKSVSVDGSASYDPDGGNIVSYVWNFGNGMTKEGALASMIYQQKGTYTVTLTVTDDEGATASDTLLVTVDPEPYVAACNDGRDNDGDGLIDLKDPGCEDAHDPSEFNTGSSGPEHGLSLVSISTHGEYGFETAVPGDIIAVEVVLANENDEDLEDLRVGFSVPDMGIKQKSSQFTLKDGRQKTVSFEVYLPYDVPLGEYYTEITVANDDIRRSTHRVLHIIAG